VRLVIDTNVVISGVYFSGPPYDILDAWRRGRIEFVVSAEILDEYRRVGEQLAKQFPGVQVEAFLELLTLRARMVNAPPLKEKVCSDPDDDKFLACAIASGTRIICSGDKALLKTSGYKGLTVLNPKDFVVGHLKRKQ
jgi:putative PIN family toxin of toxin-antitoxin system